MPILRRLMVRPGPESLLAEDVNRALTEAGVAFRPEAKLSNGRVDILAGSTAVELKVTATKKNMLKQLERYAEDPGVEDLILVTASAKLRSMPKTVGGKPLAVVYLMRG